MDFGKIQSAIQLILSSGDVTANQDVEIVIYSLEKENKIRFEIGKTLGNKNSSNDIFDEIKVIQEKRRDILNKYGIEPF